jgi:curved DNA-binding protein CbpA
MNEINSNKENLYNILQINNNASFDTIKKSYKRLSLKYHPDKQINSSLSIDEKNNQFIKIRNAYEILSDPIKRQNYDREISNKKIRLNILSDALNDLKKTFNSKEYEILLNILDNKIKLSLLNNIQIDKIFLQLNQLNLVDILYTINNFKILDIEICLNFTLKELYNNEYKKLNYSRLTKEPFEENIFPIDSKQIYEKEGETFNGVFGNFIVKINIYTSNYNGINYQILDKDLYAIINKSFITNDILILSYINDNIYQININNLEKYKTDFGNLYYIQDFGLPYYNTTDSEIDIKYCNVVRGKLFFIIV